MTDKDSNQETTFNLVLCSVNSFNKLRLSFPRRRRLAPSGNTDKGYPFMGEKRGKV